MYYFCWTMPWKEGASRQIYVVSDCAFNRLLLIRFSDTVSARFKLSQKNMIFISKLVLKSHPQALQNESAIDL